MDRLPEDIQRVIQSYLHIVSWRAELHYFRLLSWMNTRTMENVPAHIKEKLIETNDTFIYNNGYYLVQIYKRNEYAIQCAKLEIIQQYTDSVHEYLTTYRRKHICNAWGLNTSFRLFGTTVYGTMSPTEYKTYLISQGEQEGTPEGWVGCLPFKSYKDGCIRITEKRQNKIV